MSTSVTVETRRRVLLWWGIRDSIRILFARLMNRLGSPGRVADVEIHEHGNRVAIRRGVLFTVINVNGIDLYFYRWSGKYDGWGRSVCGGESMEDISKELSP